MLVCRLANNDLEVLSMRTGFSGVGARWESWFLIPLSAAKLIGYIDTHRRLILMGLVGETAAASRIRG